MSDSFDAYYKWLGITPEEQPPNHYRLLGVRLFESDLDVISNAADQRMTHIRTFQTGKHATLSQHILNEISGAKMCLLQPTKKAEYDAVLREAQFATPFNSGPPPEVMAGSSEMSSPVLADDDPLLTLKPDPDDAPRVTAPKRSPHATEGKSVRPAAPKETKDTKKPARPKPVPATMEDDLPLAGMDALSKLDGGSTSLAPQTPTYAGGGLKVPGWILPAIAGIVVVVLVGILFSALHSRSEVEPVASNANRPASGPPIREVGPMLMAARQAMARGSLPAAREQLQTAVLLARTPEEKESAERLEQIEGLLDKFWVAVRQTLSSLQSGQTLTVEGRELQVGSVAGESLTYRLGDATATQTTAEMPADLVVALARQNLGESEPAVQAALGAFYAMDGGGDRKQAEASWTAAREAGGEVLLAELSVPLVESRPRGDFPQAPGLLPQAPGGLPQAGAAVPPTGVESSGADSPQAMALLSYVAGKHNDVATAAVGGTEGVPFNDRPPTGAILIGFDICETKTVPPSISSIRPIFLTAKGIQQGTVHGTMGDAQQVIAGTGYAVGAIEVAADKRVQGLDIIFMRIKPEGLDAGDSYRGGWIGNEQGPRKMLNMELRPVNGIFGAVRDGVTRLGLWTVGTATAASTPSSATNLASSTPSAPSTPNAPSTSGSTAASAPSSTLPQAAEPEGRLPVPSPAALKSAERMIDDLFKEQLGEARTPVQRVSLAERLARKAQETADQPAARYVLWLKASELAARGGDSKVATAALADLATNFIVDELPMQIDALVETDKAATSATQKRQIVEDALQFVDRAARDNQFDRAGKFLDVAHRAVRKAADNALAQKIADREVKLQDQQEAFDKVKDAFATLKSRPNDAKANVAVGLYLCSVWKKNWDQGLQHLARGSDPKLKAVAEEDLKSPSLPADQVRLAEAWWDVASASPDFASTYRRRARHWYLLAVPHLEGIARTKAERRVEETLGAHGLKVEFFRGKDFSQKLQSRVDANVDFNMAVNPPGTDVSQSEFCVRWSGYIVAPAQGQYDLTLQHSDGGRVFLDNHLEIDGWTGAGRNVKSINFGTKPKLIRVELQRTSGTANAVLYWSLKNGELEDSSEPTVSGTISSMPATAAPADDNAPMLDPSYLPVRPAQNAPASARSSGGGGGAVERVIPVEAFYRDKAAAQQGFAPP